MELRKKLRDAAASLGKVKYALLLAALGAAVLLFPTAKPPPEDAPPAVQTESMEQRLEAILSEVDGAGQVRVMLTTKNDGVTVFQTDTLYSQGETKSQTVFYRDGSNGETALVQSETAPEYLGAVVVCEGAERAEVRLQLVKAVCALTGLTGNKISVLKMKN
ncbi:MAG: stage III sporulation protein AG [Oscillospiraceae bacterium]|nr:stage III sporulation protein AG [Oscillospiraceae bacterium]